SPCWATKADNRVYPRSSSCRRSSRSTASIRWPSRVACCTKSRRASNCCRALRAVCSGVIIMAGAPGCGHIGCIETDVLPPGGLIGHTLPSQLLAGQQNPGESTAGCARFVSAYGPINKTTFTETKDGSVIRRMPNLVKFREDPDAMLVMSLEDYDE